jgi:hypothetical protein
LRSDLLGLAVVGVGGDEDDRQVLAPGVGADGVQEGSPSSMGIIRSVMTKSTFSRSSVSSACSASPALDTSKPFFSRNLESSLLSSRSSSTTRIRTARDTSTRPHARLRNRGGRW